MKRILKISLDLALLSFVPILSWFVLSLILDKNLINTFTLTYPLQFFWPMLKSIFAVGPNITKEKDNDNNAVMSGIFLGIIVSFIVFFVIILNMEKYITFMNMDISIYKNFSIYYVTLLFLQFIMALILEKLYYEEKNDLANKYCLTFNFLTFFILILSSLLFKNQMVIITLTLLIVSSYIVYIAIKNFDNFKFSFKITKWIKYDSVELFNNIFFFFIFLFGLSNALDYGQEYVMALNFVALITDTQWDATDSISTAAEIDISKDKFNYKKHIKDSYKLMLILLSTSVLMFLILNWFYNLNLVLFFIYFSFELINFLIYPIYRIRTCYLQLEYSILKTTANKISSNILRFFISLIKSAFCTGLGQISSAIYQLITTHFMFVKNFKVSKNGEVIRK